MKNSTKISNQLNQGINTLDQAFMSDLSCLIPNGHYIATLLKVYPRMKREAITLLSFLSMDESFASKKQIDKLFQVLT